MAMRSSARLSQALAKLSASGQKVAVCETSAGGFVASALLAQAGASKFFAGGVVGYSKAAKQTFLGLDPDASQPTSTEPHAIELAEACRAKLQTEWGIGETGVAGPRPNSRGISPGACALAVVGPNGLVRSQMLYPDDTLSAEDAYGCARYPLSTFVSSVSSLLLSLNVLFLPSPGSQAPKIPREKAMHTFADGALRLLVDSIDASST